MKLIVKLKGQYKDAQSSLAGIYVLEPNPINDKSHWLQNSGSKAIWYNKEFRIWAIGSQENLGSYTANFVSFEDVSSPQEATTWQYFDGKHYVVSDVIMVDTFVEAGTCTIYSKGLLFIINKGLVWQDLSLRGKHLIYIFLSF